MSLESGILAGLAASAVGMYLEAKYNLLEDVKTLGKLRKITASYKNAERHNRISLWYEVEDRCKKYWDNRAIWTREGDISFGDLYLQTVRYANWLLRHGVGPGDAVALYMKNSPDFVMIWFASVCIGAFPALINYNLEGASLLHCLSIASAKLLLVGPEEDCQEHIGQSEHAITKDGIQIVLINAATQREVASTVQDVPGNSYRENVTADHPYCLIYTSGTTGLPKGCPITHKRFRMAGFHLEPAYGSIPGRHCWYNPMPLYHGTGGFNSTGALLSGVGIALAPRFSVSKFWNDVHDSGATHFLYVGETARYLLAAPPHPLERAHRLQCAYGNGLRPDVWTRFQERFNIPEVVEFFSSTEGMVALFNWDRGPHRVGSVGHHGLLLRTALHNTIIPVKIDHEAGDIWRDVRTGFAQRMPYEEGGEILVAVPDKKAFIGYLNDPQATEAKYVSDVFKKGDLYFRTGDALRRTPDGLWFFIDRLGDTFRWKSENVSTAEVSEAIGKFPGIIEANVYGVELPGHDGRAGCAAIQLSSEFSRNPDYHAFLSHLSSRLPGYAVPVFLRVVQASSHIHNYKQNKVHLRKEGVDPASTGSEDPRGADDQLLWLSRKENTYVPFTKADWDVLAAGKARL